METLFALVILGLPIVCIVLGIESISKIVASKKKKEKVNKSLYVKVILGVAGISFYVLIVARIIYVFGRAMVYNANM